MPRALFRPAALADLDTIYDHTANTWGVDQADHYVRQIYTAAQTILENPSIGRRYDQLTEYLYRSYPSGKHLLFYSIEGDDIVMVRILHERMDLARRLAE